MVLVSYGATGPIREFLAGLGLGSSDSRATIMNYLINDISNIKKLSIWMLDNNQKNFKYFARSYGIQGYDHSSFQHIVQIAIELYGENGNSRKKKMIT